MQIDETASYLCTWGDLRFPKPWGRAELEEEIEVQRLDARTGRQGLELSRFKPILADFSPIELLLGGFR